MNRTGKAQGGDRCEPAASVIERMGGVRAFARDLGIDPSALSKWQTKASRRGGNGLIPAKYHWSILMLAQAKAISLTATDLIKPNGSAHR